MSRQPDPIKTLSARVRAIEEQLRSGRNRARALGIDPDGSGQFTMADNAIQPQWLSGGVTPWLVDETYAQTGVNVPSASWLFPINVTSDAPEPGGFSKVLISATVQAGCTNKTASVDYLFSAPTIAGYGFNGFATYTPANGYNNAFSTYSLLLGAVDHVDFQAGVHTAFAPWNSTDLTVRLTASLLWIR